MSTTTIRCMNMVLTLSLLSASAGIAGSAAAAENQWTLASPNGKLAITLGLRADEGSGGNKLRACYRVEHGAEGARVEVLPWSPLGVVRSDQSFVDGLTLKGIGRVETIDETYTLPHGKRSACRSRARQQRIALANPSGAVVEIVLRAADDGVALRYVFPGVSGKPVKIREELTGFQFPADAKAWMAPYSESSKWTPAYEEYYLSAIAAGTESPKKHGWAFPALFHTRGRWVLVTEAGNDGTYCGCRLASQAPGGLYRIRFPDPEEGWGQGDVQPSGKLPRASWTIPWRVLIVADSPAGIVESTLVTDLNPPSRVKDLSWIKPGRVAWSWWSDHDSPQHYQKMLEFIDLAAEMGWEYFLVDANWDIMEGGNFHQLIEYARKKGVGILLWYNSGGEHNIVTERPRGYMKATEIRRYEFELLRKWGVKGIKVDFFQSDKQNILDLYHGILRDAADFHIMINFHGCTVPRGWERTWPHLMSMESVKGEECYTFGPEYPAKAPQYNTILPFTRNAVGPMDYTPCGFSDDKYPHLTTNAHELALAVLFETGWLHFADRVSAYRRLPEAPKRMLREVPVAWDETRYVAGEPGKLAALARRKGKDWYVAVINGENQPKRLTLPLTFLEGGYEGTSVGDGPGPRAFASQEVAIQAGQPLTVSLLPYGGALVRLSPKRGR